MNKDKNLSTGRLSTLTVTGTVGNNYAKQSNKKQNV